MSEALARRAARGDFGTAVCTWLQSAFAARERDGGELRLEAYLKIARTPAKVAKAQRDAYLRQAAAEIVAESDWDRAQALKEALRVFRLGDWRHWKDEQSPPSGCTDLQRNLFHAMRASERDGKEAMPETPQRLQGIIRGL